MQFQGLSFFSTSRGLFFLSLSEIPEFGPEQVARGRAPRAAAREGREREGRARKRGRGREGGRAAAAAAAGASPPRRKAAALHLWPWGAEEQVTEALPEAGLDQARGTSLLGLPDALEGEGREIGALPAGQRPGQCWTCI